MSLPFKNESASFVTFDTLVLKIHAFCKRSARVKTDFLLKGLVIGFSIAAPVGPIGVLCIRRTLADGRLAGLMTGLGAACADAVYGAIAAFGLTWLTQALIGQQRWIRGIGGAVLLYLGART